jgi:hypothetical protein
MWSNNIPLSKDSGNCFNNGTKLPRDLSRGQLQRIKIGFSHNLKN